MDTDRNDDCDSFTPYGGGDILTKKENAETDILTKFNKWINNKIEDPVNSIYMATAGGIGLAFYMRIKSADVKIQEIHEQWSGEENKSTRANAIKEVLELIIAPIPWLLSKASKKKTTTGENDLQDLVGDTRNIMRSGPLGMLVVGSAELSEMNRVQREIYYGAVAFGIAGWAFWLMKNPQVIQSGMETIGVVATATADVLEEAVDWMPF